MCGDSDPWLDATQQRAWRRVAAVVQLLPGALDAPLQRETQLSLFSYMVLAMLSEAPGRTRRMTELAALTNASLSRLSHVVRRLETAGWVSRQPSADDRRATEAVLTSAGWDKVVDAAPVHARSVRELIIDRLSDEQLAQFAEVCQIILDALPCDDRLTALRSPPADRSQPS